MIMINGEWWQVNNTTDVMRVIREYMSKEFYDRAEEVCGDRDELFLENNSLLDKIDELEYENDTLRSLI